MTISERCIQLAIDNASAILESPKEDCGTLLGLLCNIPVTSEEYQAASRYVCDFINMEEFRSIKFMLACFTLLESGDDNF